MIKESMQDFEILIVLNRMKTTILGTILVPKGTMLGCDEDELKGAIQRFCPTFCSDAAEVKRVLGWHKLR